MTTISEFCELATTRRSVRRFRPEKPPRELIEEILDAAVAAPSASNRQPWRFVVLSHRESIERLASAVRSAVDRIALAVEPEFENAFRAYGDYFTRFAAAPVVITVLFRGPATLSHLVGPRISRDDAERIEAMERDSGLIGASLAIQNLLLAAHASGLGASAMTGPLVAADEIRAILSTPPGLGIVAMIPIGYADEIPPPTTRRLARAVTEWIE